MLNKDNPTTFRIISTGNGWAIWIKETNFRNKTQVRFCAEISIDFLDIVMPYFLELHLQSGIIVGQTGLAITRWTIRHDNFLYSSVHSNIKTNALFSRLNSTLRSLKIASRKLPLDPASVVFARSSSLSDWFQYQSLLQVFPCSFNTSAWTRRHFCMAIDPPSWCLVLLCCECCFACFLMYG